MSYQFGFGNDDFGLDDFELAPPLMRALQPLGREPGHPYPFCWC
jgi:hypothetical protein